MAVSCRGFGDVVPNALDALVKLAAVAPVLEKGVWPEFEEWITTWGFSDDWVRRIAEETLNMWRAHPAALQARQWHWHGTSWYESDTEQPLVWNPLTETEHAFRARADAYIARMKNDLNNAVRSPGHARHRERDQAMEYSGLIEPVGSRRGRRKL
jgi:hypothetical protein